jgi:malonate-semialdehyde dehydrogenase (acetylating)/methylmalonate-semialdehyde dehydrogenase
VPDSTRQSPAEANVGHLIDGRRVAGSTTSLPVFDPALGREIRRVAVADRALVDVAVDAATQASIGWRETTPLARARVMFRFKTLVEQHADRLAAAITEEHGKVLGDAHGELKRGIENVEYACAAPELLKGAHSRSVGTGIDSWSELCPLGVVAGITPSNFPAMVPMWMFPLALVCGNSFVLKPSEKDPSPALMLGELLIEAGLPPGVFNVVNGDARTAEALIAHPGIGAVSFVGASSVAESVYRLATASGKRVQALGSAKNHAVVMPDADLDNVVSALLGAAYGSCGERCMAISVVVAVGEATADRLVASLTERIGALRIGNGRDPDAELGPLITAEHRDRVRGHIDRGVAAGAELVVDGRKRTLPTDGYFLGPCLFDRVTPEMEIYRDEIFGPVLCVVRAASLDEAVRIVNAHHYGNGACIFTRDGAAARRFSDRITVGMVGVNVALPVPVAFYSFGGWKRSLYGDLHVYGPDAVRFYTRQKVVSERWPTGGRDAASFTFPGSG